MGKLTHRPLLVAAASILAAGCGETSLGPEDGVAVVVGGQVLDQLGAPLKGAHVFFHLSTPLAPPDCGAAAYDGPFLAPIIYSGEAGGFEHTLTVVGRPLGASCVTVVVEPGGRLDLRPASVVRLPAEFRSLGESLDSVFVTVRLAPSS